MTEKDRRKPADAALAETVDSSSSPNADRAHAAVPKFLGGRYEVRAPLGQGAFGTVFSAYDRVADRTVAIKIMSEEAVRSPQILRRVRRELQAAVQVTHPAVVRIHDLLDIDGRLMLSMELIDGETLAERLRREPKLPIPELITLFDDLTQALAAAHVAGVIHRDLKPANIMIRKATGRAVVTDFGLSRLGRPHEQPTGSASASAPTAAVENPLTVEGELMGTPQYMAPEQLIGRDVGAPADLYALGAIMFEAAAGKRPHDAKTVPEMFALRMYEPVPSLAAARPEAPTWLCEAVDRCMRADQKARPADATVLRQEIERWFARLDEAPRENPKPRPRRWPLYAASLAILAALGGLFAWQRLRVLPSGPRVVTLAVRNDGAPADAWLGPALTRLLTTRIRDRAHHYTVTRGAPGNVAIEVGYRRDAGSVRLSASYGRPHGRRVTTPEVAETSALEAVDKLVAELDDELGHGQPERGPDAEETDDMRVLGAKSFAAYQLYHRAVREGFGTQDAELENMQRLGEETVRLQPDWPHAHALLILSEGSSSTRLPEIVRRAKAETASSTDASGRMLIEALSAPASGDHKLAAMLDEQFRKTPQDALIGWALYRELHAEQRIDEALAVSTSMLGRYPDLQFGGDATNFLRIAGRRAELPEFNRRWIELAPESEEALVSQARLFIEEGQPKQALEQVHRILLLYGQAPQRTATLADVLLLAGDYAGASEMALRLLRGSPLDRARGYNRLGNLAVVQGRFTAGYEHYSKAVAEARTIGNEWELLAALYGRRSLAPMLGGSAQIAADLKALEDQFRVMGRISEAATTHFERDLDQSPKGRCPDADAALREVPLADARLIAQRQMLREAAVRGCGRCADVLRAGQSSDERDTVSLFDFGLCAQREGALQLAQTVFEQIENGRTTSYFHWVLASYHRAEVLERMNRPAEARTAYQQFLSHWLHADRPLPEMDAATHALERLK